MSTIFRSLNKIHQGIHMKIENNPLKQYFRRPALYIELPSGGKGYKEGVINIPESGQLPVYPMTAIDEITARTPDALFNGSAVVDIIKSCIPDILKPWEINSQDLDAILIAIKSAANGNQLEIISVCPSCNEDAKYDVNLTIVLQTLQCANYDKPLSIQELEFKFRPLTYREMQEINTNQFQFQRELLLLNDENNTMPIEQKNAQTQVIMKNITEITMRTLATTIEYIKTPTSFVDDTNFILDFMRNCDRTIYIKIRDHVSELRASTEIKPLNVKCIHCSHEYKQEFTLNMSDFFE